MKKLLSLSLMLSLGLATISPALNAAQAQKVDFSTKQLLAKWWKGGRKMSALTPAEQQKLTALKRKIGVGAVLTAATTAAIAVSALLIKEGAKLTPKERAGGIVDNALIVLVQPKTPVARNAEIQLPRQIQVFLERVSLNPGEDTRFDAMMRHINEAINRKGLNAKKDNILQIIKKYLPREPYNPRE